MGDGISVALRVQSARRNELCAPILFPLGQRWQTDAALNLTRLSGVHEVFFARFFFAFTGCTPRGSTLKGRRRARQGIDAAGTLALGFPCVTEPAEMLTVLRERRIGFSPTLVSYGEDDTGVL